MVNNSEYAIAKRKQKSIEEKFLNEIPVEQREFCRKIVELYTAATIYHFLFDNLKGESLVNNLVKSIPQTNCYEKHGLCYPTEQLEVTARRYVEEVEASFKKLKRGFVTSSSRFKRDKSKGFGKSHKR